jgi:hypothetical protein
MKKLTCVLTACTLLAPISTTLAQGPGSSGVLFLLIAPGARPAGMGEAFVAIADEVTATYWNPAGLAFQEGTQLALMHSNWLPQLAPDLYYDYATARRDLGPIGTAGFSVTFINLGEQVFTDESGPEPLGTFTSYELSASGSFGTKITANSAVGVTLKFIYSNLAPRGAGAEKGDGRASAFAFDLGYLHKNLLVNRLSLGANLSNVGPKITYIDAAQADPLPTNLRLGLAYHLIQQEFNSLLVTGEVDRLLVAPGKGFFQAVLSDTWNDGVTKYFIYNVGAEYWYNNLFALRTGYHYDDEGKVKYISFGAGLKYSLYRLDFGYVSAGEGHPLSDTMRFSLTIGQ